MWRQPIARILLAMGGSLWLLCAGGCAPSHPRGPCLLDCFVPQPHGPRVADNVHCWHGRPFETACYGYFGTCWRSWPSSLHYPEEAVELQPGIVAAEGAEVVPAPEGKLPPNVGWKPPPKAPTQTPKHPNGGIPPTIPPFTTPTPGHAVPEPPTGNGRRSVP